jgi:hypothetical protein
VKCSCNEHHGKKYIDKVFNMTVDEMYDCLFGNSEFQRKYWKDKKFLNLTMGEWNESSKRVIDFSLDLGTFGVSKNAEEQVLY